MDHRGTICRTSRERGSFELPVSQGCPYNACAFCDMYKGTKYRDLPLEQVKGYLQRVCDAGGKPKRVMLGEGNAFYMDFDRLMGILRMVREYLPSVTEIASDASVPAIARRTDEQLAQLHEAGYCMVYVGIESGSDEVLAFMHKDHDNAQARKQLARLHAAGIDFGAHIMTGVAGAGHGMENARATAAFLNETRPAYICNFSMNVAPLTELGLWEEDGLFTPASVLECLQEERELVSLLDIPVKFEGYHITQDYEARHRDGGRGEMNDYLTRWIHPKGNLPEDRQRILDKLDAAIAQERELEARQEAPRARQVSESAVPLAS